MRNVQKLTYLLIITELNHTNWPELKGSSFLDGVLTFEVDVVDEVTGAETFAGRVTK